MQSFYLSCILLTVPLGAFSQAGTDASMPRAQELTLAQALDMALTNNQALMVARTKGKAARGAAMERSAFPNPELELTAEEWPVSGGRGFRDAKQTIGVAQRIPWPGKRGTDIKAGQQSVLAQESAAQAFARNLQREVAESFFRALAVKGKVEAASELLQVSKDTSAKLRRKVEAGAAPSQESLRADVESTQIENEQTGLKLELEAERTTLSGLIGLTDTIAQPVGSLEQVAADGSPRPGPEKWLAHHPAIAGAEAETRAAELRVSRARIEAYPDVTFGVAGGVEGPDRTSIVEFRMGIPLPLFDRKKGQRLGAEADLERARLEMEGLKRQLVRSWELARRRELTSVARVDAMRRATLPNAREALRLVRAGYEEGKFTMVDLLDTQRTLTRVLFDYQDKLLEMNLARAELAALSGRSPVNINDLEQKKN